MAKPIYQTVKESLIKEIENAAPNTPIMSERELAVTYNISRMTARRAIQELVTEGYLYTNKNKGTFVSDEKLRKTNNVAGEIIDSETKSRVIHFNMREADKDIAEKLELAAIDKCIRVVRVNYKDNHAASVDEIYINSKYVNNDKLEPVKFLEQFIESVDDMVIQKDFVPIKVPIQYAHILDLELDTAIIKIETTYLSVKGKPYIYSNTYNNPKRVQIRII